ncbi:hypothetical protein PR202_ga04930 [Eleusine coracana subsp. coracana]|uniref:PWWP domain-containing protein n=1 Tax=Eleusine coracana subsp. coracana TaxID=191504 RepID=A0AAV5BS86_ELECO|nr:hypothetical protein PR202_ga04930 [Eleusine coracana subsp. coracana]
MRSQTKFNAVLTSSTGSSLRRNRLSDVLDDGRSPPSRGPRCKPVMIGAFSRRSSPTALRKGGFREPAAMVRTRSQAKTAMKRKAKPVPSPRVAAPEAAAGEGLVGNFGLEVDADAVMVDGAVEERAAVEAGVQMERNAVGMGDAAMVVSGTVGGVVEASDFVYETESAGMIEMKGDEDVSGENIGVPNGDGWKGNMGLEPGCLHSEEKAAAKGVELSSCFSAHHIEAEPNNSDRFTRYCLPCLGNGDFRVSDLVWSKLEDCSWWPGEIFDPANASELALKHKMEGNYLVAYFGSDTFVWRDESQLMPFIANYAHMEKQCSSDDFINAVNHALEELSRRIFGWDDSAMDISSTMNVTIEEHVTNAVHPGHDASERGRGWPKQKPEDGIELTEKKETYNLILSGIHDDFCESHNRISLNSFEDSVTGSHSSFKIVECKQQAASQLTGPSSAERSQNEPTLNGKFDVFGEESGDELTVLKGAKWKYMHENDNADPKELLPQLCSVAIEPLNKNICSSVIISYFSYYKNYVVTASNEANISGKDDSRRDQRKKEHSPEVESADHMQDSYWSGLSLQDGSICSREMTSSGTRPRRKRKSSQESFVPPSQHLRCATLAPNKQIQVMERPIVHADAKIADELKPTALILSFGRSAALPSEMDLVKVFSRYGPLKEAETEVHKDTNTAKVVFKKRLDAERGLSVAGKFSRRGAGVGRWDFALMSSGAVAASDPGGGEPKLVPGADVEMTEATEEAVPAPVAGVKVEGKAQDVVEGGAAAAAMDVGQDGGDAAEALSDPLYATESAGMVTEEGRGDEPADGVNGGGGGGGGSEEKVQAGAGGLQGEVEKKPVLAEDVAAPAVAGQAVEAASSATPELTVAEPGRENEERDNGVAHYDNEVQNNVPDNVVGSSKIHEDNGAPVVDQLDDGSEMCPQTVQDVSGGETISIYNEAASSGNVARAQCARYCLPPLENGGFRVSDLVWGKVKSHPWWPGEIFDPSDASDLALKHQKKDSYLVAYFGDSTFAWCDESQLKPFVTNYSQMEKQSSSDAFVGSVNNALEELSRRILSGMSCSCLPEELSDSGMSYTVENAGLKDGVTCSAVNRFEILKCFSPENLLHYIKELALFPGQGGDLLELVIACSQLTSFYRSKGCSELASFQTGDAWVEDGMDTPLAQNVMVEEAVISEVQPTQDKPKRGRGRPRKQKPEYDTSNLNANTYHDTMGREMVDDSEKSSTPTVGSSFKIGECIRRAASQLAGSTSIVKAQNEPTAHKSTAEAENGEFDVVSDDADDELTVLNRAKRRRMYRNHTADPSELLSQLCVAATEPMNGHGFSAMVISYFSDYRNYVVSTATEASIVEKSTSKRGRKRKVLPTPEVETTDHMQDSYWSGLSLHNHPIHSLTNQSSNTRPRRRRKSSRQTYVPLSELGASPKKQIQVIERSIIHVDEKMVDELKPTALVLSFGRAAHVPSETNLIKMFSRYGPLRETETEVDKDTNTVKVVFKKRSDAERAFSVAGKYGTFGPSLRSYRLVNLPFSLRTLQAKNPEIHPEDRGPEVSGQSESSVPLDAMQVDQVVKTDKNEVVEEPAGEHIETAKETSQMKAAGKALINQIDMVEKIGLIDAELTGLVHFGTGAQTESVAEGSPKQVSSVERACTQKETSVEGVSETTQPEAAAGASNGSLIGEIQLAETSTQALLDDTANTMQMEPASVAQAEDTVMQHADATNDESTETDTHTTNTMQLEPASVAQAEDTVMQHADATNDESTEMDTQANIVAEGPKQEDNAGIVAEDSAGVERNVGSEALKQVSGEVPCSKLETITLAADPVGLDAVEQVKGESETVVEVSGEQMYSIEQSVQVGSVTEASEVQIEVERQTPEDKSMVDATLECSVIVEETLDSKVEVPVEENVDNIAAVPAQAKETTENQTTAEAMDEKMENKAAAEALPGEAQESKTAAEAPNEITEDKTSAEASVGKMKEHETEVEAPELKTESKDIVEPLAREKENTTSESTAEAPIEETRTAEETVEDVKALHKKTTTDDKTLDNATVVTPDEKTATAEETVEDAAVETPDGKTLEVEKIVEDTTVGAPDEKSEKTLEDTKVDAPGVQADASEQTD